MLGFDESATLDPARRQAVAKALVERLDAELGGHGPGPGPHRRRRRDRGRGRRREKTSSVRRRIVLISDLQQGSRLDALGDFEWPSDVELDLKTVATEGSNAGLQWLAGPDAGEPTAAEGRTTSGCGSRTTRRRRRSRSSLAWTDDKAPPIPAYVPPGESRVVRVPRPAGSAPRRSLRLQGDTQAFDNMLYLAAEPRESATVLYVGRDAPTTRRACLYYLKRVFPDTPRRAVKVEVAIAGGLPGDRARPLGPAGRAGGRDLGRERRDAPADSRATAGPC